MELELQPKREAWKRRGHTPMELEPGVLEALAATYKTGVVGILRFDPDDDDDASDAKRTLSQLRSGAKRQDKRLRVQETDINEGIIRYEMVDLSKPKPKAEPLIIKKTS